MANPQLDQADIERDMELAQAVAAHLEKVAERVTAGEVVGWKELASELDQIALSLGCEYGIPWPDLHHDDTSRNHQIVLARRTPMRTSLLLNNMLTEQAQELASQEQEVVNSWEHHGDAAITIIRRDDGTTELVKEPKAGRRMRKYIDGAITRALLPQMTAEAELRALASLKTRIKDSQYDSYVLNGVFPELSKRSQIHYMFRKGLPTLACSARAMRLNDEMRCIAALCFHPMGYYSGTHVGVMTPTDEVIAALLMMRADERKFWAKSGQWQAHDERAGL